MLIWALIKSFWLKVKLPIYCVHQFIRQFSNGALKVLKFVEKERRSLLEHLQPWNAYSIDLFQPNSLHLLSTPTEKIRKSFIFWCSRTVTQRCSVKKMFLKFCKFHRKTSVPESLLRPTNLLEKRLWYRCFSVNPAKLLRTPFLWITSVGYFKVFSGDIEKEYWPEIG